MRTPKIKVYTSITGGKDELIDGVENFTNDMFTCPRRNSRVAKMMPHRFFNIDWSIYIDGNVTLKIDPQELIKECTGNVCVFPNPYRSDIYSEGEYCIKHGIGDIEKIEQQLERYEKNGFISTHLAMCGIIVRKHTPDVSAMNEKWFVEYCMGGDRDQLSFPVAFEAFQYLPFQGDIMNNKYFSRKGHII